MVFITLIFFHRKNFQIMGYLMISRGNMEALGFLVVAGKSKSVQTEKVKWRETSQSDLEPTLLY